jgi:hypothetical protein
MAGLRFVVSRLSVGFVMAGLPFDRSCLKQTLDDKSRHKAHQANSPNLHF